MSLLYILNINILYIDNTKIEGFAKSGWLKHHLPYFKILLIYDL